MLNTKGNKFDNAADASELLDELSQSTSEAVKSMRQSTRMDVRIKVFVEQASLSMRDGTQLQGVTGDISVGGSQILLARPLRIGDVYQISFDREEFDLPPVYAVCLRARQVRPDAFEAGMRFLEQIELPQSGGNKPQGLI
jgi:c-di-GMP-binding flagellar brake protein YcgR